MDVPQYSSPGEVSNAVQAHNFLGTFSIAIRFSWGVHRSVEIEVFLNFLIIKSLFNVHFYFGNSRFVFIIRGVLSMDCFQQI